MADDLDENLENAKKGVNQLKNELKDALGLQKQMEQSVSSYLSTVKQIGDLKRSIAKTEKQIAKEELRLAKQRSKLSDKEVEDAEALIAALKEINEDYKEQVGNLGQVTIKPSARDQMLGGVFGVGKRATTEAEREIGINPELQKQPDAAREREKRKK